MPRDLPDWHGLTAQATVHEITDLGELAVRLGSIVSFDRRGDVVWFDDFEDGIAKWVISSTGTDASIATSTAAARNGDTSVKIVYGSGVIPLSKFQHSSPFAALSCFGFEYSFYNVQAIDRMVWLLELYNGSELTAFSVQWDDVNNVLQYLDNDGNYVTFRTGVTLRALLTLFHTGKLVVDANSGEYVRFLLDDIESDLSELEGQVSADATAAHILLTIRLYGRAGVNDVVYVDDVILTQNEPN